jgi:hypothetical protein
MGMCASDVTILSVPPIGLNVGILCSCIVNRCICSMSVETDMFFV